MQHPWWGFGSRMQPFTQGSVGLATEGGDEAEGQAEGEEHGHG